MKIEMRPIAYVKNKREEIKDDNWADISSEIVLAEDIESFAFEGIEAFSHLHIIFYMNQVNNEKAIIQFRHPRNDSSLPKLGTYAQRNKNRPNKIGLTTVELISRSGSVLQVKNLDAIDGTPILDIKPVMKQFQPSGEIIQPEWVDVIMSSYW